MLLTNDPDERALLNGVLAAPLDDAPRLILADWYDENGQEEMAEFIRVQCELESLGFGDPEADQIRRNDRVGELARRQRSLWAKLIVSSWSIAVSYISLGRSIFNAPSYKGQSGGLIRRGFVAEVRCTLADWMAHGPQIVSREPVQRVVLTDCKPLLFEKRWFWHNAAHSFIRGEYPDRLEPDHLPAELFFIFAGFGERW
jgi:repeat-companion domain TIGR02996